MSLRAWYNYVVHSFIPFTLSLSLSLSLSLDHLLYSHSLFSLISFVSGVTVTFFQDASCTRILDATEPPLKVRKNTCSQSILSEDITESVFATCSSANKGLMVFMSDDCGSNMYQAAITSNMDINACIPVRLTSDQALTAYIKIDCDAEGSALGSNANLSVIIVGFLAVIAVVLQSLVL